jgi:hypothetical protein
MSINKKCNCTPKSATDFCPNCSRLKAVIMLKNGNNNLKLKHPLTNKMSCPVWYCRYSKNGKSDQQLAAKMRTKIAQSKYAGLYNVILFYDNLTNTKLPI